MSRGENAPEMDVPILRGIISTQLETHNHSLLGADDDYRSRELSESSSTILPRHHVAELEGVEQQSDMNAVLPCETTSLSQYSVR